MASVFLSYDHDDGVKARIVADALQEAGHSVWWDPHIKGGSQYTKEIEQALGRSDAVVVLWSAKSIESAWVRDEAAVGRDSGRLIPVRVDDSLPPLGFRQYQTIDLTGPKGRSASQGIRELLESIAALAPIPAQQTSQLPPTRLSSTSVLTRRAAAAGLVAAGTAGAAGYWLLRDREPPVSPEATALLAQAWQAWAQGTSEGNKQAIGLYRRATDIAPDYADAWGFLGCANADRAHAWATAAERPSLRERAKEAGRRALELDSKNAYGRAAIAYAQPIMGNWLNMEREFRQALQDQPGKWLITYSLALLLLRVGRNSEAAELFGELAGSSPTATQYLFHIYALWGSGQLDEAERLLEEANSIYETHPAIWYTRLQMLIHGGRAGAAVGLAQDAQARPSGVSEQYLNALLSAARAMASRTQDEIDSLITGQLRDAHGAARNAITAIQYASALGRVDEAFEIADAYFFSRGFTVPDEMPTADRAIEVTLDSRETLFLFLPQVRAMRADARFERLVDEIGLERYWREAGAQPDYRNG